MINASLTYQWLGPGLLISLGIVFLLLHLHDRRQLAALKLAGAYFASSAGFTQIMLVHGDIRLAYPSIIQISLFTSHLLLIWGVFSLYRKAFPTLLFALAASLAFAIIAYTRVDVSLFWLRLTAASGFMIFADVLCGLVIWRVRNHKVDVALAAIFLLQATITALRVLYVHLSASELVTPATFAASDHAATMQTANAFFAVLVGIALVWRFGTTLLANLTRLADTDPLTGLVNRRAFEAKAQALRAASAPLPTGLIICDIDHFKQVNDTYGHQVGDMALKAFAQMLHENSGGLAVCTRLGGEEFCILLPASNSHMIRHAAISLRIAAEKLEIETADAPIRLTASFGYCELAPKDDLRAALARVDTAVYQAKSDGRNLVRQAMPPPAEALFLDRAPATG